MSSVDVAGCIRGLRKIAKKANQENLSDYDATCLRDIADALSCVTPQDFQNGPQEPSTTVTWYAAFTQGWNAHKDGKSMADVAITLERFKKGMDDDPHIRKIGEGIAVDTDSPTERFKESDRVAKLERRLRKLEGAIQQLWEDTQHD